MLAIGPQQAVDRLAHRLADQIPQGDVRCADRAHAGGTLLPPEILDDRLAHHRIAPHQDRLQMRDQPLSVGRGRIRRRAQEGMALDPLVGDEAQQTQRARAREAAVLAVLRGRNVVPGEQRQGDVGDFHCLFLPDFSLRRERVVLDARHEVEDHGGALRRRVGGPARLAVTGKVDPGARHGLAERQAGGIVAGERCPLEGVEHERQLERMAGAQPAAQHRRLPGEQIDEHVGRLLRHLALGNGERLAANAEVADDVEPDPGSVGSRAGPCDRSAITSAVRSPR